MMKKMMGKVLAGILAFVTMMSATCISTGYIGKASAETAAGSETLPVSEIAFDANYTQNAYVDVQGRTFYDESEEGLALFNSASGFTVRFVGKTLTVNWKYAGSLASSTATSWFSVFTDGETDSNKLLVEVESPSYADRVLLNFEETGEHTVRVLKRNDSNSGSCYVASVKTDGYFEEAEEDKRLKVEVYGDSITAGSGILREVTVNGDGSLDDSGTYTNETQNVFQSYAGYMAQKLNARLNVFARGGITMKYTSHSNVTVLNDYDKVYVDATRYGDDCLYDYTSYTPDVVVIYLGTNDYFQSRYIRKNSNTALNMLYSANGLKAGFELFIRNVIGRYYGKDIPIFLCSGMMAPESALSMWMEDIKDMLKDDFKNLETVKFEACAVGHPIYTEGQVAGETLANAILAKLEDLNK